MEAALGRDVGVCSSEGSGVIVARLLPQPWRRREVTHHMGRRV